MPLSIYLAPMKQWLAIITLFFYFSASAQKIPNPRPVTFRSFTSFPAFPLYALDSSRFNSISVLNKKEPVVIIYFSPTCSHCQHQVEEITSHMNDFKTVKFLLVSSYAMQDIKEFVNNYALSHFPNFTVGSDPGFSMGQFFEVRSLPGVFVYNKNGKYKTHFETNVLAPTLIKAIRE